MATTTDPGGRYSACWHESKAILDAATDEGRSLRTDELARIEDLDAEMSKLRPETAQPVEDALARAVGIFAAANGRALTKRQTTDLAGLQPAIRAQFAENSDPYLAALVSRTEEADPEHLPPLYQELARYAERDRMVRKADAFQTEGVPLVETSSGRSSAGTSLYSNLFDVESRALMTSTSSSALATTKNWPEFSDYLTNASAALQSGVRIIDIDQTSVKVPAGTALATGAWLAEGGTATASDMGVTAYTVTPARLTVYSEVTREALEDNSVVLDAVTKHMFVSLGALLDSAIYEGTGASNEPQGMLDLAGSGTAVSAGTAVDLQYFLDAYELGLTANAPVKAWATNPAGWGEYADLKVGGTASYDLRPLLQRDVNSGGQAIAGQVLGVPLFTTGNIDSAGAGTATIYAYDPDLVWVVRRRQFDMIQDPYSKAEQGIVRFVLEGRFGVAFPQPSAVNVFSILTP